tara:strand:- start:188 stop:1090 length:903 start_codon:yes stop_codon:yes gene_type:complete
MIKIGLIGYGRYGKKYHQCIKERKDAKIIKILKKKKIKNKIFTSNENTFFKSKDIDLYIIASPSETHFHYLKKTINKKKNIICEKPIVTNSSDLKEIISSLKKFKKILLVNHSDLYNKNYKLVKKNFNKIGKIKKIELIFGKEDIYKLKANNNKLNLPHFEWLPHPLAIINNLLKLKKNKFKVIEKREIVKKFIFQNLLITLLNKIKITIKFYNNYNKPKRNIVINGDKGKIIYKGYDKNNFQLIIGKNTISKNRNKISPMQNIIDSMCKKIQKNKKNDDRKLAIKVTKDLLDISRQIKI